MTYNKTCVASKDSDQPVHPSGMVRVLVHPFLDSLNAVEGASSQTAKTDQTVQMRSMIFAGCTSLIVGFVVHWLIF